MSLREEHAFACSPEGVLDKQHTRVKAVMTALIEHIGFIRPIDRTPEEWAALAFAEQYLERAKGLTRSVEIQRKPVGSESGSRREERVG
jgi:hypothetical protein